MKLLVVSIAFPPKGDPECIQTGRYYKALKATKEFDLQVLTSKSPTLFMNIDRSLEKYLSENDNIIEIPIYETKLSNFLMRKLKLGGVDWPDSKFSFHLQWKKAIKQIIRPDIIYSRSFPLSSAIMAYRIAAYYNVPWVLHLSDPWTISPIHSRSSTNQRFHNTWEMKCFGKASRICFTSEATLAAYSEIYPQFKRKFEITPNVPYEHIEKTKREFRGKLRIVYTGGLAGLRSPKFFLQALENAINGQPDIENRMEVVFAGKMDRGISRLLAHCKIKCVKHIGNVSLDKSIEWQYNSDILLSIDNPIDKEEKAMFIPSKICDYITSGRRVLALTTKNSSTSKFLQSFNADVVDFDDIYGIQYKLKEYLTKYDEKDDKYFQQNNSLPPEVKLPHNVEKLSHIFHEVIAEHG